MKTLSIQRPRPPIEIWTPGGSSVPVKARLVNWLAWSALKISALPKRAGPSASADTQNETSIILDNRRVGTARLAQSLIATR